MKQFGDGAFGLDEVVHQVPRLPPMAMDIMTFLEGGGCYVSSDSADNDETPEAVRDYTNARRMSTHPGNHGEEVHHARGPVREDRPAARGAKGRVCPADVPDAPGHAAALPEQRDEWQGRVGE